MIFVVMVMKYVIKRVGGIRVEIMIVFVRVCFC